MAYLLLTLLGLIVAVSVLLVRRISRRPAKGMLRVIKANTDLTDDESRQSGIDKD